MMRPEEMREMAVTLAQVSAQLEAMAERIVEDSGAGWFLTTEALADELDTTPETLRGWRMLNKGPRAFTLGRRVLYARSDVREWKARTRVSSGV